MTIRSDYFIFVDILIFLIYLVFGLVAFKNGFISEVVHLIYSLFAVIAAWILGPILAERFLIIELASEYDKLGFTFLLNSLVWSIIIFFVLKILYLLLSPILKGFSKIPFIGFFNRVFGLVIGLFNATIIILFIGMLLSTPLVKNGKEVKDNTTFKYVDSLSKEAISLTVKYVNLDLLKDKAQDVDINEIREQFTNWLIEKDILDE